MRAISWKMPLPLTSDLLRQLFQSYFLAPYGRLAFLNQRLKADEVGIHRTLGVGSKGGGHKVTGKPGLLARGFVKGHGPVDGWERGGADSREWHQGQGKYADYRWYGDVSVDNFNAVLYGYAVYYDLAASREEQQIIDQRG